MCNVKYGLASLEHRRQTTQSVVIDFFSLPRHSHLIQGRAETGPSHSSLILHHTLSPLQVRSIDISIEWSQPVPNYVITYILRLVATSRFLIAQPTGPSSFSPYSLSCRLPSLSSDYRKRHCIMCFIALIMLICEFFFKNSSSLFQQLCFQSLILSRIQ